MNAFIMELDQWKNIWQQQKTASTPSLKEMLGKRSHSPIAKMKRNLIMELVLVLLGFGFIVVYYFRAFNGKFQEVSWVYLALLLLFIGYVVLKFRLLRKMECMSCEVKSNLYKQIQTLEKFTRFYLIAGTAIIPLIIIFFYLFAWIHFPDGKFIHPIPSETNGWPASLGIVLLVCIVSTVGMYYLNKWYIRKLYGNQINRLKEMLDQLD